LGIKLMVSRLCHVRVPEVLQPYMMGISFIPFRKQLDKKGKFTDLPAVNEPTTAQPAAAASAAVTAPPAGAAAAVEEAGRQVGDDAPRPGTPNSILQLL
jgi:hypothetical protein